MRGFGALIHVLHHEEIEFFANAREVVLGNPRVVWVGGDDPESFDFASVNGINDLIVSVAGLVLNLMIFDAEVLADFFAVRGVGEVVSAEKVSGVREEAGAHRIALTGDGVRSGAGFANVTSHQLEIDDCLCCSHSFVALIDAHGPPPRDALAGFGDEASE